MAVSEGNLDKAKGLADRAVQAAQTETDPVMRQRKAVLAYNTRGRIAETTKDYATAAADAQRVLKMEPGNKEALARWHANKDRAGATALPAGTESGPATAQAAATAALPPATAGDLRMGQTALKIHELQRFISDADKYTKLGDRDSALHAAEGAGAIDAATGFTLQAKIWSVFKDFSQALVNITKAIEALSGHPGRQADAYAQRAGIQNDKDNPARDPSAAIKDASAALALNPDLARAFFERGKAEKELHDPNADADLQAALDRDPRLQGALDEFLNPDGARKAAAAAAGGPGSWAASNWQVLVGAAAGGVILLAGFALWMSGRPKVVGVRELSLSTPTPTPAGRVIGGHILLQGEIDRGGMGMVLKGIDTKLGREVAVKRLLPELQNQASRDRIFGEAKTLARFHHPNIVEVYEAIQEGEDLFIVCPLLDGHTVHTELNTHAGRRLPPSRALEILSAAAAALDYSHGKGVIHRDMKPANIMVTKDGRILVMDYGIAKSNVDHSRVTRTDTIVGTPAYGAPEQEYGSVCRQSDVWALAVTAYEMLSGRLPFGNNDQSRKLEKRPARFTAISALEGGLPPSLNAVFEKALDPEPTARHKSCADLVAELQAALRQATPPV